MSDLSVSGPGSPISLKKILKEIDPNKKIVLLVDGTGTGFIHDTDELLYVTPEECSTQALYYVRTVFDGVRIPAYLYRYLHFMFIHIYDGHREMKYKTDIDVVNAIKSGEITDTCHDYLFIKNLIIHCNSNDESRQIIGLVQLIGGALNIAKKNNAGIRLYIDKPETSLHPKKQSNLASMFLQLEKDYSNEQNS